MANTMQKQRMLWVDNLKFFLIYLVVLGHCIQYTDEAYKENFMFYLIYSFHMPLFMLVSGFVSYRKEVSWGVIRRRFKQLMIPFLVYTVLASIIKFDISVLFNTIIRPESGLWFLWALLFIVCFNTFASKIAQSLKLHQILIDAVIFIGLFVAGYFWDIFCIATIAKFYIYYTIGLYIRRYENTILNDKRNTIQSLMSILLWGILVVVGFYNTGIACNTFFKMLIALIGSVAFVTLFKSKVQNGWTLMQKVGGGTLGIYAIHWYLLWYFGSFRYETGIAYYLLLTVMSVALLALSYLLVVVFRKNRITSFLFLGEQTKK